MPETPQQMVRRLMQTAETPVVPTLTLVECPCGTDYVVPGFTACPACGTEVGDG